MKKFISIALVIVFALILSTVTYAQDSELKIKLNVDSSKTKSNKIIELSIELYDFVNVDTKKPMAAEGTLVYDETLFESVEAVGNNGWTATLSGKKFLLDTSSVSESSIVTFKFKLKENIQSSDNTITFGVNNFSITNDDGIDYEDLVLEGAKVTLEGTSKIQDTTAKDINNTTTNNSTTTENQTQGNNTQKSNQTDNTTSNSTNTSNTAEKPKALKYETVSQESKKEEEKSNSEDTTKIEKVSDLEVKENVEIPYAGDNHILVIMIALLIFAVVAFVRYKVIDVK